MRSRGVGPGIDADFGPEHADTFRRDLHPDLRADYFLANPPFNAAQRGTNFALPLLPTSAFLLPTLNCPAPHGMAGFVLGRFWFFVKSKAACVFKTLDNPNPGSFRKRRQPPSGQHTCWLTS
jgi:hypothetical protein